MVQYVLCTYLRYVFLYDMSLFHLCSSVITYPIRCLTNNNPFPRSLVQVFVCSSTVATVVYGVCSCYLTPSIVCVLVFCDVGIEVIEANLLEHTYNRLFIFSEIRMNCFPIGTYSPCWVSVQLCVIRCQLCSNWSGFPGVLI